MKLLDILSHFRLEKMMSASNSQLWEFDKLDARNSDLITFLNVRKLLLDFRRAKMLQNLLTSRRVEIKSKEVIIPNVPKNNGKEMCREKYRDEILQLSHMRQYELKIVVDLMTDGVLLQVEPF